MKETESTDSLQEIASLRQRQAGLEHELSESRALHRELIDSITHLFFARDKDLKLIWANKAYQEYLGKKEEDIIGKSVGEIFGDGPKIKKAEMLYRKVLESGEPFFYREEYEYHGEMRTYEVNIFPSRIGVSVLTRDITDLKKAEQERERLLSEVENERRRLESLMEALPVGVSMTDSQGADVTHNRAFERVWGLPLPETTSVDDYDRYKAWWPETGQRVQPDEWASAQSSRKGETITGQLIEIEGFDGVRRFVDNSAAPIRDSAENIIGSAVVIQDISDLKRAEALARQQQLEIESLYRNAQVGLCMLDRDLRYVRINERLAEINGIPAADHIGKTVREIVPDLADIAEPAFREVIETGVPKIDIEFTGETAAQPGVKRSWLESWLPIFDKDGTVTGLNVVVVETTTLKRIEEELRDTNRGLEATKKMLEDEIEERTVLHELIVQKNQELEGFAFKVSHELKNNLIVIKRMMQMAECDPDFLRNNSPLLVQNSERLIALVERTLELARSGRKIGETQEISLDALVRSLFMQMKPEGVEGELIIREELPDIRGDSRGIEEVFSNLISNSFEHRNPEKEKVVIEVRYKVDKAHVLMLFSDNGTGISKDDLEKVFDPAFTTKKKGGFGFGLAIAKKVVEAHGGSIEAQSKGRGQGAEFIITLPQAQTC